MSTPGHVAVELPPTAVARQNSPDPDALAVIQSKPSVYKAGMRVVLQDVTFSVPSNTVKGEKAKLLSNVSGYFEPGQMTALMGPSGSGKTTLLDIIAGRKTTGATEGSILFGSAKPTPAFLRRYTGYVEQFDTLIPSLTVYEMLMYTAELKRPHTEPLAAKRAAVEELLERLALTPCRDVKIGSQLSKGISGGQAKRVNIGIALITNPRVLFLDEPTSGLDSFTANEVMTVVKGLVSSGVTIVATIHSPTAYAFSLFDRVMMLSRGHMVYAGPPGPRMLDYIHTHMPQDLVSGRAAAAGAADVEGAAAAVANQAEYLVDLVTEADRTGRSAELAAAFASSSLRAENDALVASYVQHAAPGASGRSKGSLAGSEAGSDEAAAHAKELAVRRATVTPSWHALKTLIKYRTTRNYLDPAWLMPRFADKIIMGLLVMTLYWQIGGSLTPTNINNQAAVLFMWVTLPAFGAAAYLPAIVLERALYVRERNDGLYRVITYLLAKAFDELALALVTSLGVAAFVFWGVGFNGGFALFWLTYYVTLCFGIMLAYFVAAIAPNMDAANAILPTYVTTLLFFGGLIINFQDMPVWWKWFSYIDPIKYGWGALMVNQFSETNPVWNGVPVLTFFGFQDTNQWQFLGIEAVFFFVFFILAYVVLSVRKFTSR